VLAHYGAYARSGDVRLVALFAFVLVVAAAIPAGVLLLRDDGQFANDTALPTVVAADDERSPFGSGVLRNIEVRTDLAERGSVFLANGTGTAEGSAGAGALQFRLSDLFAFGDLDGQGPDDAAMVLVVTRLGRPYALQLTGATNTTPVATATAALPASSLVRELHVAGGEVTVRFRDRDAGEERLRRYAWRAGELSLVSDEAAPPVTNENAFAYAIERVTVPSGGEAVLNRSLPPGVGADFIIGLGEGQGFSLWAQSEFSNAILSVFGTRDQRTVVSRADYVSQYTGVSPVAQDYVVRVINVGGSELPFQLTVTAPGGTSESSEGAAVNLPATEPPPGGFSRPQGELPLAAIAPGAASAIEGRSGRTGLAVLRLSDSALFTAGSAEAFELVSAVKVLIALAVMSRAEAEGRELEARELDLLWPMITFSDNDSATLLWQELGSEAGIGEWLESAGIEGFTPAPRDEWGATTGSAAALAVLFGRLYSGDIVSPEHRDLALEMMAGIIDGQRWGVSAGTTEAGAAFALKNGWFPEDDGWQVVSAGIVIPGDASQAYAIAFVSDRQPSLEYGIETIELAAREVLESVSSPNGPD